MIAATQQIRFLPVSGGRVAVATVGDGPPLVLPPPWISHVELEWEFPEYRAFVTALAAEHTVIRYDRLGIGLSDAGPAGDRADIGTEAGRLAELLDGLGVGRAPLLGISWGGCVAVAFARPASPPGAGDRHHRLPRRRRGRRSRRPARRGRRHDARALGCGVAHAGGRLDPRRGRPRPRHGSPACSGRRRRPRRRRRRSRRSTRRTSGPLLPGVSAPMLVTHRRDDRAVPFAPPATSPRPCRARGSCRWTATSTRRGSGTPAQVLDVVLPFLRGHRTADAARRPRR